MADSVMPTSDAKIADAELKVTESAVEAPAADAPAVDAAMNDAPAKSESSKSTTAEEKPAEVNPAYEVPSTSAPPARQPFRKYDRPQSKSKFDASQLPESNDPVEIRRQVEFYFSDANLPFDKFLFGLVTKDNKAVPLKMIADFKRMKRFTNFEGVLAAMKESELLEVIEEEGAPPKIKRKVPLELGVPKEGSGPATGENARKPGSAGQQFHDKMLVRSIYVKGFGEETPTTQVDIETFLQAQGPIIAVRLRREDDGLFKGSVFAEFKTAEEMKKFMEMEPKAKWNDSVELLWKSKEDYVNGKMQDIKDGKIQPRDYAKGRGGKHKFNAFLDAKYGNSGDHKSKRGEKNGAEGGDQGSRFRGGNKRSGYSRGDRDRGRDRGGRSDRGRGPRSGRTGRGGRDGDKGGDRAAVESTNGNGVPVLQDSTPAAAPAEAAPVSAPTASSEPSTTAGTKRKAEDAPDSGAEVKKTKTEQL